jgi:diadenylate cyclase
MLAYIVNILNYASHPDFSDPMRWLDAVVALALIVGTLNYLRRFPVFRVVVGITILILLALVLFTMQLIYTGLVVGSLAATILLTTPLIFASEIRHYLEKIGRLSFLRVPTFTRNQRRAGFINDLVDALFELADRKVGALIVLERQTGLGETIETGEILDAQLNTRLLENIFFPKSPLHDGAVVVVGDRILAAGCLLPINGDIKLASKFGTRHRSGLAITHDTDAVVLIVSEQRGEISLAENSRLHSGLSRAEVTGWLQKLL